VTQPRREPDQLHGRRRRQSRYAVLAYTADPDEPATWKILLPGPSGTEDLYGTQRFLDPDAAQLQAWLSPACPRPPVRNT